MFDSSYAFAFAALPDPLKTRGFPDEFARRLAALRRRLQAGPRNRVRSRIEATETKWREIYSLLHTDELVAEQQRLQARRTGVIDFAEADLIALRLRLVQDRLAEA